MTDRIYEIRYADGRTTTAREVRGGLGRIEGR